ncbi:hypothetical protein RRV45_18920 [Bacillus sp. DTU_2020_1000418_1_SI_GHA_SEK_038]|uniref:ATP-binding protein n=1 Tax=Bacillus sp. DTU_2020_1000418_1_SI_GHA_SEK_038 TaxID=3077585 RepID=UPI0028E312E5|nr:ATP-binding protein [Bacillus sp. DTU_2020_1000418_1_SI_GHA_SEK_038]WNS74929.1 hypothetical protein RRV45_18920 [Bacillus sp. DTU_2020_1000418_1_SI_GHA_SEK_038]
MEQIILNLLDNLMKYSFEGAETGIIVSKDKQSVRITVRENGKEAEFTLTFKG